MIFTELTEQFTFTINPLQKPYKLTFKRKDRTFMI